MTGIVSGHRDLVIVGIHHVNLGPGGTTICGNDIIVPPNLIGDNTEGPVLIICRTGNGVNQGLHRLAAPDRGPFVDVDLDGRVERAAIYIAGTIVSFALFKSERNLLSAVVHLDGVSIVK